MSWQSRLYDWRFRKTKRYHLEYGVTLAQPLTEHERLLLPYPPTTTYQTVYNLDYRGAGEIEQHDRFILLHSATTARISCDVTVQPRRVTIPAAIQCADYRARPDSEYYCQPDHFVHSQDPRIQAIAQSVLESEQNNLARAAEQLYEHTLTTLHYGNPIADLYTTDQALSRACVDCGGFSTYLAALLRACQIPCRMIAGFWAGQRHNDIHAWLEYLLPTGVWVALDPSVDYLRRHGRTHKVAGYNFVGSDRIVLSVGSDHHLHIAGQDIHVGILQTPLLVRADGSHAYISNYQFITT